jgi:YidC/Oxa1 family membrane protein insertase
VAEIIGAIERALGAVLNGIYQVIPAYGVAIILLTLAVRTVLIPLAVKQIKGMAAQQKLAPEMKKIQAKYKQLQQKAKDRQEVQQLRVEMQRETQALYSAHGASMFGGCLPVLGQFPVLIAMFAVFRASIVVVPLVATTATGGTISADLFEAKELKSTICRPIERPSAEGTTPTTISCPTKSGDQTFTIGDLRDGHDKDVHFETAPWIAHCRPNVIKDTQNIGFTCNSNLGTGHLPRDGKLFADLTADRASMFGLHSGCSAAQIGSEKRVKECTTSGSGGTAKAIPYWILILAVAGTTYYQSKQMMARSSGQQMQQQQMMMRITPVLFGFLSINFPAGLNVYMLTTNIFSIGQQGYLFKKMGNTTVPGAADSTKVKDVKEVAPPKPAPQAPGEDARKRQNNKSKKGKKRR